MFKYTFMLLAGLATSSANTQIPDMEAQTDENTSNFEELIQEKLGHFNRETRAHPNVEASMGQPAGGWRGWSYSANCEGIGLPCRYKGAKKPHKVLVWVHGAMATGFLPSSFLTGLDANKVLVVQPIMPKSGLNQGPYWHGVATQNVLDPVANVVCAQSALAGLVGASVPKFLKPFVANFKTGLADKCNVAFKGPTNYKENIGRIANLIKKVAARTGNMRSVVVGGYSQGGTVAADAALYGQDQGVGALVIVGSSVFNNSPSMSKYKDFRNTRFRFIAGSRDIWFPPAASAGKLRSLQKRYKLKTVGAFPQTLNADHLLLDSGAGNANAIFDALRDEIGAATDFKANPILPYDAECCSADYKKHCPRYAECVKKVDRKCWDSTSKRCNRQGCAKCKGKWWNVFCVACLYCQPYEQCIGWEWCLKMPFDKCQRYDRCTRGAHSCTKPKEEPKDDKKGFKKDCMMIRSKVNRNKCLDAAGARQGGRIHLWDCNEKNHNQRYIWDQKKNALVNLKKKKCLDLPGGRYNSRIISWGCHGGNNQKWYYDPKTERVIYGGDKRTCLDIDYGRMRNGTPIRNYKCHNGKNQKWEITSCGKSAPPSKDCAGAWSKWTKCSKECGGGMSSRTYKITQAKVGTGKDCDIDHGKLERKTCNPTACPVREQLPRKQCFLVRSKLNRNKCLDAQNRRRRGTQVHLWDCSASNANQVMYYNHKAKRIQLHASKRCLDLPRGKYNSRLIFWDCHRGSNQKWFYDSLTSRIKYGGDPKTCMDVDYGRSKNGTGIRNYKCHGGKNQQWEYSVVDCPGAVKEWQEWAEKVLK